MLFIKICIAARRVALRIMLITFIAFLGSFFGCAIKGQDVNSINQTRQNEVNIWNWLDNREEWYVPEQPGYAVYDDMENIVSRGRSIVIKHSGEHVDFQGIWIPLPNNYDGQVITVSGFIKTENVSDGYAGLFIRIDPQIAFNSMSTRGVIGTTDWTEYEISLRMNPEQTTKIYVGALLVGKGIMWLNDLRVYIDGKDISEAEIFFKQQFPAEEDKEFDNGSHIMFPTLNDPIIDDLELLGRIWGFLKYYHPEIGKGNYNWDYELFRMLPEYLNISSMNKKENRDNFLLEWINQYGEFNDAIVASIVPIDTNVYLSPDRSWIENSNMHEYLKDKLHEIYKNKHQGKHYYIGFANGIGNPMFLNENPYSSMKLPDAGFRLLTLYRYWNMIRYFFPYVYITDNDWNDVLKNHIPAFINADSLLDYELASLKLIFEVNDGHAGLGPRTEIEAIRGNKYPPFRVWFIEGNLVITDYFNPELKETVGLEIGDIITHINGESINSIVERKREFYPASNEAARLTDIALDMLRSNDETINIMYNSHGELKQMDLQLYERNMINMVGWRFNGKYKVEENQNSFKLIDDDIGYITLAAIQYEDISKIKEDFQDTKGIIIDIRNYPAAFVPFVLGSFFVSQNTAFAKFTKANQNHPGEFNLIKGDDLYTTDDTYQGKLVVLINEISQSLAEYTAMAFRAGNNTTIIGSTTAGADGDYSRIWLPGGMITGISGIGIYYPDGTQTQRVGIVPDVWIEPTIECIRQGRDEVLEKAVEIIRNQ